MYTKDFMPVQDKCFSEDSVKIITENLKTLKERYRGDKCRYRNALVAKLDDILNTDFITISDLEKINILSSNYFK